MGFARRYLKSLVEIATDYLRSKGFVVIPKDRVRRLAVCHWTTSADLMNVDTAWLERHIKSDLGRRIGIDIVFGKACAYSVDLHPFMDKFIHTVDVTVIVPDALPSNA